MISEIWEKLKKKTAITFHLHWFIPWWRQQMKTCSALLVLCVGNPPVTGGFPSQGPVTRNLDYFFDLRLNKRLDKQSRGWWFETPSRSLWRQCNSLYVLHCRHYVVCYCCRCYPKSFCSLKGNYWYVQTPFIMISPTSQIQMSVFFLSCYHSL